MGTCEDCRFWSEMIARAGGGTDNPTGAPEAVCLAQYARFSGRYTTGNATCETFARNTAGRVDGPPDYGADARATYAAQADIKYKNGRPMFARDGTMLDPDGNRSIFDDVHE